MSLFSKLRRGLGAALWWHACLRPFSVFHEWCYFISGILRNIGIRVAKRPSLFKAHSLCRYINKRFPYKVLPMFWHTTYVLLYKTLRVQLLQIVKQLICVARKYTMTVRKSLFNFRERQKKNCVVRVIKDSLTKHWTGQVGVYGEFTRLVYLIF